MKFAETYGGDLAAAFWSTLAPEQVPDLWSWSTSRMVLPDSETSSLGSFSAKRAGPFRRIHDIISSRKLKRAMNPRDPHAWRCAELWVIWSAQCGKTVSTAYPGFSWSAKHFPHQPAAFFWPGIDVKKAQVRDRLEPLWQATPELSGLMPVPGTEDYTRRIGERTWRLGNGLRAGLRVGNIANDVRANPYCNLYFDEFDALKLDVGGQGDPIKLAIDRQRSFFAGGDNIAVGVTTPSTMEAHGWRRLCEGTHERLMVRCLDCGGLDWPNPDQLRPVCTGETAPTAQDISRGDLAAWACRYCGVLHRTDAWRTMVEEALAADRWIDGTWIIDDEHRRGLWTPSVPLDPKGHFQGETWPVVDGDVRSIHGNLLMTDVWTLGKFLSEEMRALAGSENDRKTHWNTARAEPYFPNALAAASDDERQAVIAPEVPRGTVPAGALYLILQFDQQGNTDRLAWFPWVLRGIAPGGESWLIDCGQVPKPGGANPGGWDGVNLLCEKRWLREGGGEVRPQVFSMDGANGVMAAKVRNWAAARPGERVLVWGNPRLRPDELWQPYVPGKRAKIPWPQGVRGFALNSNYWRDRVDERRRRLPGAPGWWMPENLPAYYLKSVWDSEVRVIAQRQITGQGVREVVAWEPATQADSKGGITYRRDNHWWDCEVAITALINIYGIDVAKAPEPKSAVVRDGASIPRDYLTPPEQSIVAPPSPRRTLYQRKFTLKDRR